MSAVTDNADATTIHHTPAVPLAAPLVNLSLTLALTCVTLAAVGARWGVGGYEMLIVAMGWPHVILGFVFNFGKVLRGERGARMSFVILTLLTLLFWGVHYLFAVTALIYIYFLYHAFRDEITIYLSTRSNYARQSSVYNLAGVAPLILLMLVIPQPSAFRQDLRRAELSGADFRVGEWTLLTFEPVANSRGRHFYFTLQAPHTEGQRSYATQAIRTDLRPEGEMRVNDLRWNQAADLRFQPHYAGEPQVAPAAVTEGNDQVPVLLTGGHRVGQTFTAERDYLSGIWLPINVVEGEAPATHFLFRLASPALLPLSPAAANIRLALICALGLLVLWRLVPQLKKNRELWAYLAVFVLLFAVLQAGLKALARADYAAPMIFQFVVVFHYWSWYVFSARKMRRATSAPAPQAVSFYDRMLAALRRPRVFLLTVIVLNAASVAAAWSYYQTNTAPAALRFALDYHYFLYFLVLHVTFSFAPGEMLKKKKC